jgi:hypothetical protein
MLNIMKEMKDKNDLPINLSTMTMLHMKRHSDSSLSPRSPRGNYEGNDDDDEDIDDIEDEEQVRSNDLLLVQIQVG